MTAAPWADHSCNREYRLESPKGVFMKNRMFESTMLTLLLFSLAVSTDGYAGNSITQALIPQPVNLQATGRDFLLTAQTAIVLCDNGQSSENSPASSFNKFLKQTYDLHLRTYTADQAKNRPATKILVGNASRNSLLRKALKANRFKTSSRISDQGYQLWVTDDQIFLHANTQTGLFYGFQTLKQLLFESGKGPAVKGVTITDYPRYRLRGFQFDAARSPHSIALMKRIVRICSAFKLNFVMFREGDDEFNAVRYKTNKLGSLNPRAIPIDQMAEFIQYAAKYHVKVIPEIESLGHSGAKAFLYPELVYGGRKTRYDGIGYHLRKRRLILENPQTYRLLRSIYSEWVPIITSPYIHLGCDEAGRGTGQHLAKLTGILNELAKKSGKTVRPIVWADAAATADDLKTQVIRCLWAYGETGGKHIDQNNDFLRATGQNVIALLKPGCREQVIMAGGSDSYHTPLAKCKYENALANIHSWCQFGKDRPNFIGILAVQWSGNQQDLWLPDNLTVAEYGWTPDKPHFDYAGLMARIKVALSKIKDYTNPKISEVDRPAWDGIWLDKNNNWLQDIMGLAIPIEDEQLPAAKSLWRSEK